MSTEKKVLVAVVSVVALLAVIFLSSDVVEQEIRPELQSARIAIQVGNDDLARTGPADIESGTPFRLHAVVEARTMTGKTIYYTDAVRLAVDGREIPSTEIKSWTRSTELRILWFTVEGYTPYLELGSLEELQQFRFQENFHPEWPRTWSIPGELKSPGARDPKMVPIDDLPRFGTQRFHVRVEVFGPESDIVPRFRFQSAKATSLPAEWDSFPTVSATLPGLLEAPSRVFGLTQMEPVDGAPPELVGRLKELHDERVAFSRLTVLRAILDTAESEIEDLEWVAIELGIDVPWSDNGASPGDLIRVGDRWVSLLEDRGDEGLLDGEDLCLDFHKGAKVARLGDVFTGEGLVEWADLGMDEL